MHVTPFEGMPRVDIHVNQTGESMMRQKLFRAPLNGDWLSITGN